jgi:hypothetical protein
MIGREIIMEPWHPISMFNLDGDRIKYIRQDYNNNA